MRPWRHSLPLVIIPAIIFTLPIAPSIALEAEEIVSKASQFVVRIDGEGKGNGTGFIVRRNGSRYTVLTNEHVVKDSLNQRLSTYDGKVYSIGFNDIKVVPGVDLAEIEFSSDKEYLVAQLSKKSSIQIAAPVFTYGWNSVNKPIFAVRAGRLYTGTIGSSSPSEGSYRGYTLTFNLPVVPGLSGSPLLNLDAEVIGIYGLTSEENTSLTFGIPIGIYQSYVTNTKIASAGNNVTDVVKPSYPSTVSKSSFPQYFFLQGVYFLPYPGTEPNSASEDLLYDTHGLLIF